MCIMNGKMLLLAAIERYMSEANNNNNSENEKSIGMKGESRLVIITTAR